MQGEKGWLTAGFGRLYKVMLFQPVAHLPLLPWSPSSETRSIPEHRSLTGRVRHHNSAILPPPLPLLSPSNINYRHCDHVCLRVILKGCEGEKNPKQQPSHIQPSLLPQCKFARISSQVPAHAEIDIQKGVYNQFAFCIGLSISL